MYVSKKNVWIVLYKYIAKGAYQKIPVDSRSICGCMEASDSKVEREESNGRLVAVITGQLPHTGYNIVDLSHDLQGM